METNPRVVIITGASRGLGKEIALRFGRAGAGVVVNYHYRERDAVSVAEEICRSGGQALPFQADVRGPSEVNAMTKAVVDRWGSIHVLVNNAGLVHDNLVLRMTEREWDDVLDTNLKGVFHCVRSVSPFMIQQHGGHIINVSSIVGLHGREGQANYSASKAGLIGFTKAAAKELGSFNIKVNAVLPGYLPTEMGETVSGSIRDRILNHNVLGRISEPREIAEFVYQLSLMNNVSGQVFNLDSRIM